MESFFSGDVSVTAPLEDVRKITFLGLNNSFLCNTGQKCSIWMRELHASLPWLTPWSPEGGREVFKRKISFISSYAKSMFNKSESIQQKWLMADAAKLVVLHTSYAMSCRKAVDSKSKGADSQNLCPSRDYYVQNNNLWLRRWKLLEAGRVFLGSIIMCLSCSGADFKSSTIGCFWRQDARLSGLLVWRARAVHV